MDPAGFVGPVESSVCSLPQADVLQSVFFGEYPPVERDPNASSIQLIPIADKPNIPL